MAKGKSKKPKGEIRDITPEMKKKAGTINKRFRDADMEELIEFYIEGGNLVRYSCYEDQFMECDSDGVSVTTYYPIP